MTATTDTDGITEGELERIEREHPEGISSGGIVAILDLHGLRFSEATLRKYVQIGLLPHSVRVGRQGGQRGSVGVYPTAVIRQIVEIKRLLDEGHSIDAIRTEFFLLRSEIETLEQKVRQLLEGIDVALHARPENMASDLVRRDLREVRSTADELIAKLRTVESRLSMQARFARGDAPGAADGRRARSVQA